MTDAKDARAWIAELAAAGPKASSAESRHNFAEAVLSQLKDTCDRGMRAEKASGTHRRIEKALWQVGHAFDDLIYEIDEDPAAAQQCGLNAEKMLLLAVMLACSMDKRPLNAEWEADRRATPRPGRKNRAAVEVAAMVAREYEHHFGRPAGRSKQGDKNNPFFRVCKVVERILETAGCDRLSIGDSARSEGIDRAALTPTT